jgi:hypothetical protein
LIYSAPLLQTCICPTINSPEGSVKLICRD